MLNASKRSLVNHKIKLRATSRTLKKRPFIYTLLTLFFLTLFSLFIYYIPPAYQFQISNFKFQIIYVFFALLFCLLTSAGALVFRSFKHGILIALFVCLFLIFRLNDLTHPFFVFMLAALFVTLELFFSYRK